MKRSCPGSTKFKRLCKALDLPPYATAGVLELLWHYTSRESPQGNVGQFSNAEIAEAVGWDKDPGELIEKLVAGHWLDLDDDYRLLVHGWPEHCDQTTKRVLAYRKLSLIYPQSPQDAQAPQPAPNPQSAIDKAFAEPAPEKPESVNPSPPEAKGNASSMLSASQHDASCKLACLSRAEAEASSLSLMPVPKPRAAPASNYDDAKRVLSADCPAGFGKKLADAVHLWPRGGDLDQYRADCHSLLQIAHHVFMDLAGPRDEAAKQILLKAHELARSRVQNRMAALIAWFKKLLASHGHKWMSVSRATLSDDVQQMLAGGKEIQS